MSSSSSSPSLLELCQAAVRLLRDADVNFLAIDFDHTFIDDHTAGKFKGTASELGLKVRTVFRHIVPLAFQHGLFIAIVTFSGQVDLIKQMLMQEFPEQGHRIVIRGNDRSWARPVDARGKTAHISDAVEEIKVSHQVQITIRSTILIDDDNDNIEIALTNRTKAILYIPEDPNSEKKLVNDIITLMSPR